MGRRRTNLIVLAATLVALLIVGATIVLILRAPPPLMSVGTWGWVPCATDSDCGAGLVCRTHNRPRFGPIRACRFIGSRKQGERCVAPPGTADEACHASLNCNYSFCGTPCSPSSPASCPPGTACRSELEESSCVPVCQDRGCDAGERCVRIDKQLAICGRAQGECDLSGCPAGQQCRRKVYAGEVILRCIRPCSADPDCGPETACESAECIPRCDLGAPNCPQNWTCAYSRSRPGTYCHPPL